MALINHDRLLDIPCKVCGDRSSGKHYGLYSCDGKSTRAEIPIRPLKRGPAIVPPFEPAAVQRWYIRLSRRAVIKPEPKFPNPTRHLTVARDWPFQRTKQNHRRPH